MLTLHFCDGLLKYSFLPLIFNPQTFNFLFEVVDRLNKPINLRVFIGDDFNELLFLAKDLVKLFLGNS